MLIVGIADRPNPQSFGVVPFIVRTDEGRLLVAGHQEAEIDEERLRWLYRNPIGALDVSQIGARLDAFARGLVAGWVGGVFMAECKARAAPLPEIPAACHAVPGEARFWIGPSAEVRACRQRWVEAAARQVIRTRDRTLADLMLWADPRAPEREAAVWYTRDTREERDQELQWFSQMAKGSRRRTKKEIEAEIRRTIERLKGD
ncbi:MAG: hypothetical protein AAB554_00710 [Patescibacteria group bacterium]